MKYTDNYSLKKPDKEDFYNINDFNDNADIIDLEIKAANDKIAAHLVERASLSTLGHVNIYTASGILEADKWTGEEPPYTQEVTISGITGDDEPKIDISLSDASDYEEARDMENAWSNIHKVITSTNKLTFYFHEKPEIDLWFRIRGVR